MELREKIKKHLDFIYKSEYDESIVQRIVQRVEQVKSKFKGEGSKWTEKDILLITYGDSIINDFEPTLQTLKSFLDKYFKNVLSYVHILPFFPYSSDDGFSVIDYKKVDPKLGNWSNVEDLSADYKLMFDLVINHISQYSDWYQNYLQGKKPGKNYFIEVDPELDLSAVVRPRSLPLLTSAETPNGIKHVWTTFSEDQIDLNFANPELLAEMVDIFLLYFERGATMIRLDAIAFLWKEIGSNCLHLPETHEFVKLLRDLTDYISPELILLTETNVPNKENLSYFGDNDEANMVY
jgi:sucrose phosphorylase